MKQKFIVILFVFLPTIGICQNKYYHLLDHTCESCWPSVFLWNVDRSQAIEFGDYIEEYTDSLQRVTKLLVYSNNQNKRAVIDDWDYVLYEYTDSTIVAIELESPQWWYPLYATDSGEYIYGSPTAERCETKYDSNSKTHDIISSTYQTIRGWEYYATQLVDCNYYATYEQAFEYVKSHFIYTEEIDSTVRIFREPSEAYVPYYSYTFCKNGIGQVEPMGVTMRANRVY